MADSNRCQAVGHVGENQEYYKQAVRKKSCYIHTRLISELSLLGYVIHLYVPEAI